MLKRFHLNGHTIGLSSQNCVIAENIHTPRGGQRKFRGEGGPESGVVSRGYLRSAECFFFTAYAINKCQMSSAYE